MSPAGSSKLPISYTSIKPIPIVIASSTGRPLARLSLRLIETHIGAAAHKSDILTFAPWSWKWEFPYRWQIMVWKRLEIIAVSAPCRGNITYNNCTINHRLHRYPREINQKIWSERIFRSPTHDESMERSQTDEQGYADIKRLHAGINLSRDVSNDGGSKRFDKSNLCSYHFQVIHSEWRGGPGSQLSSDPTGADRLCPRLFKFSLTQMNTLRNPPSIPLRPQYARCQI